MNWLDRLLRRDPTPGDPDEQDKRMLSELRSSFERVHARTERVEQGLKKTNSQLESELRRLEGAPWRR